jgi:hypothetical protein
VTDLDKISGVKSYLRRTKTPAELQTLADAAFLSASEEVTITSISGDGTASSGQVSFPKWLLLQALEEILSEGTGGRQLFAIADRSGHFTIT